LRPVVVLASLSLACAAANEPLPGRVLVVGLDGATNKVIDLLIDEGELANLAAIARMGVRGAVRPEGRILSPRIWTTFTTGVAPEQHGVKDWVKRGPGGGLQLYSNLDRRVPALWNIASAGGRRVGIVNWLMTQPPDRVNGVMISDHAIPGMTASRLPMAKGIANQRFGESAHDVVAPEARIAYAWPNDWVERSAVIRSSNHPPLTKIENPFLGPGWQGHSMFDFLRSVYRDDELTARTALEVEASLRPELLMVYLPGIDRVSHLLWQGIEVPEDPPAGVTINPAQVRASQRTALLDYYRFTDALLGRLLEGFGEDDFVLVISDHGFEATTSRVTMSGIHESEDARNGILYARGPGIAAGSHADAIRDTAVLPTLLAALGLPQAEDLPGSVAPFLHLPLPAAVASYNDTPFARIETPASAVGDEIIEKLRTLGYVE